MINTGLDVASALYAGYVFGRYSASKVPVSRVTTPAGREVLFNGSQAAGRSAEFYWANRTGFSQHVVDYQLRTAPQSAVKIVDGKLYMREYAYKSVSFDGYETASNGVRAFVESKSDGGFLARLARFSDNFADDAAKEMVDQFLALRGEVGVIWEWRVETEAMAEIASKALGNAIERWLAEAVGPQGVAVAAAELRELIRVIIVR